MDLNFLADVDYNGNKNKKYVHVFLCISILYTDQNKNNTFFYTLKILSFDNEKRLKFFVSSKCAAEIKNFCENFDPDKIEKICACVTDIEYSDHHLTDDEKNRTDESKRKKH